MELRLGGGGDRRRRRRRAIDDARRCCVHSLQVFSCGSGDGGGFGDGLPASEQALEIVLLHGPSARRQGRGRREAGGGGSVLPVEEHRRERGTVFFPRRIARERERERVRRFRSRRREGSSVSVAQWRVFERRSLSKEERGGRGVAWSVRDGSRNGDERESEEKIATRKRKTVHSRTKDEGCCSFDLVDVGGEDPNIGPFAASFGLAHAGPRLPTAPTGPVATSFKRGRLAGLARTQEVEQLRVDCATSSPPSFSRRRRFVVLVLFFLFLLLQPRRLRLCLRRRRHPVRRRRKRHPLRRCPVLVLGRPAMVAPRALRCVRGGLGVEQVVAGRPDGGVAAVRRPLRLVDLLEPSSWRLQAAAGRGSVLRVCCGLRDKARGESVFCFFLLHHFSVSLSLSSHFSTPPHPHPLSLVLSPLSLSSAPSRKSE